MEVKEHIRVEIGELVLTGFDRMDTDLLAASFERELTRLLRRHRIAPVARELVSGLPPLPHTTSAHRLGEALARSVHSALLGGAP